MSTKNLIKKIYHMLYKRHIYGVTSPLRVLPDFMVIGVGRGGTTSLYHYLGQHPCIVKAAYDELGFFDTNFGLGIYWYRSLFPTILHKRRIILKWKQCMTYDVTPSYIRHPWIIQRILKFLPNVKLIAILRNPVDRAYSHYHMGKRDGNEKRTFDDVIKIDIDRLENKKNLDVDEYFNTIVERSYLARGFYAEQLQIWMDRFPKEQLLVISSEDLANKTDETLAIVFDFLKLPNYKIRDLTKRNEAKYPPMNPDTRKTLVEYFKPYNEKLYSLLGRKFDWDK